MNDILEHAGPAPKPHGDLVRLTGVHKYYGGGLSAVHALDGINLQMGMAEMVAICGPAGSGKTTLLNLIGMLEFADEGSVVIANLLIARLPEQARANLRNEMMGFVFQAFTLIPVLTARENVLLPLMLRGRLAHKELHSAYARADELLGLLGLATHANTYPQRLDPSQSQRVAIARALLAKPRLVLADEPTSRLDSAGIRLVMDLFAQQQHEHGTAFIVSTRDQRQLNRITRTLQLLDGRLHAVLADASREPFRVQL
ncbi:ABC transporter ATP-binding protein [Massilia antarctica]|uniref:ABC transporter ATP-binding protein n=1 Tax=Massilia antarctica TaxID=2765360 RepID=UPI0006BB585C|nr:ABC transporter ATP-binding protein [Massilia sp. H27-R4]MCY0912176.1 ABC transporter ATP-binding protein [Massilia sp. H27-R4]CUI06348.1 ABC transporter, ATP-binding protein [Janthinobacterium sp. CG23_2]CUU30134.1 ABC transporter, ATP-binding protein [Janthinobacterium sp. CG23_2]